MGDFNNNSGNKNNPNKSGNNDNKNPLNQTPNGNPGRFLLILLIVGSIFILVMVFNSKSANSLPINYNEFIAAVKDGKIFTEKSSPLTIYTNGKIQGKIASNGGKADFTTMMPGINDSGDLYNLLRDNNIIYKGDVEQSSLITMVLLNILPIVILIFLIWFMFKQFQGNGNKAFSFGKSKARKFEPKDKLTFNDVAGIDEAKTELSEVVDFLKDPQKFTKIGAKIPKGVLLIGPPGTGKTLLARAVAGEAGVDFFHMSGSDFVEMFVGVGASRVRDLFDQGRKSAPCILFIDELDAVGRTRGAGYGGGHDEREQTLNQLLVEMDGFDPTIGVILLAATNRPDVLDPALLRPGRFDRQVVVDRPDVRGREEILKIHVKKITLSKNINLNKLAKATPGFSGADLANMCNEAALYAARHNKAKVSMVDFEEARDKVLMGVARKSKIIPPKDKKITSYHEAGHTIIGMFVENSDPLHKVTVIPRGMSLGSTWMLPDEDMIHQSKLKILDQICIFMGGRVAEEITFGDVCTGASQDIASSTDLARKMVTQWGMSDILGTISYGQKDEPIFIGKEIAQHKDYSEKTAEIIDSEIKKIVTGQYDKCRKILMDNQDKLKLLAETLYEKETMDAEEVYALLGMEQKENDYFKVDKNDEEEEDIIIKNNNKKADENNKLKEDV